MDIFLEKFRRQRQLFYLLCFKAFGKQLGDDYCRLLFLKVWRKYSITFTEMSFFVQTFSLKRAETWDTTWKLQKSWEMTAVKFFSKKLQAEFSLTFPEMHSAVNILLGRFWRQNNFFILLQNSPKYLYIYIYMALKRTVICLQCVLFLISEC